MSRIDIIIPEITYTTEKLSAFLPEELCSIQITNVKIGRKHHTLSFSPNDVKRMYDIINQFKIQTL